ncbi:MAG: flavodoxin [Clostridia bacterium]|nr:flavodoxin [Clostridia bacterium]
MSKVAVVYWSGTGNTEAMANEVESGAKAAGAEVSVFTAAEFNDAMVDDFDAIAFGCPSMGSEELEDSEFAPMFNACEAKLSGKKVGLFGSYGWGDGEWMRNWEETVKSDGANLVSDGVICNEAPDDEAAENCRNLGKALASSYPIQ